MVNLYEAKVGDYVMFRNKGHAKIKTIEVLIDEEDCEDYEDSTHELSFEGVDDTESFGHDGKYYAWEDTTHLLDISDVIPAYIVERELQKKAAEEITDECPF